MKGKPAQAIAIAGKFSVRNDVLEKQVYNIASEYFSDDQIALSSPLGALNFPARIHTTRFNAQIKNNLLETKRQILEFKKTASEIDLNNAEISSKQIKIEYNQV